MRFSRKKTGKGELLKIVKSAKIEKIAGETAVHLSGSWRQTIPLSGIAGGSCRVSFRQKSIWLGKYPFQGYVLFAFFDADGNRFPWVMKPFATGSGRWQDYSAPVAVPAKADARRRLSARRRLRRDRV